MEGTVGMTREAMIADFINKIGEGISRKLLAADASFRRYERLELDRYTAILMDAPPPKEDVRPFLKIDRHLVSLGYSAPLIYFEDVENGLLLLEDLGDATFTRLLAEGEAEWPLYRMAADLLIDLHRKPVPDDLPAYDHDKLLTEAALLADWYAPAVGIDLGPAAKGAYLTAWSEVLPLAFGVPEGLVLRDFHVDNLMRLDGRSGLAACGLLDFQDAVIGPVTYDLVSLLEDARRDVNPITRSEGRQRYLDAYPALDREAFDASWATLAAQRHAKVIGIFTRLCKRDGKPAYLRHIPRLWRLFERALQHPGLKPVKLWLDAHIPAEKRLEPKP